MSDSSYHGKHDILYPFRRNAHSTWSSQSAGSLCSSRVARRPFHCIVEPPSDMIIRGLKFGIICNCVLHNLRPHLQDDREHNSSDRNNTHRSMYFSQRLKLCFYCCHNMWIFGLRSRCMSTIPSKIRRSQEQLDAHPCHFPRPFPCFAFAWTWSFHRGRSPA